MIDAQPGDKVVRIVAGRHTMLLQVTAVTEQLIFCGPWKFDKRTGAEVDEDLDWGPPPLATGSYLEKEN